mgnify:FL=1
MKAKTNLTMLCDFYELTMANGYFANGFQDTICYFDMFFRKVPDNGGFAIMAGVEQLVEYLQNLTFTEVEAATIPSIASEVDLAVINSNYALGAGLNPVEDALALESSDSPYVNVLVCKEGNENNAAIQALAEALHSDAVKNYIAENFDGAVIAVD